jgi:hypothetical protein
MKMLIVGGHHAGSGEDVVGRLAIAVFLYQRKNGVMLEAQGKSELDDEPIEGGTSSRRGLQKWLREVTVDVYVFPVGI